MITITTNGTQREVPTGLTITTLLAHLNIRRETAIVEHNHIILDKTAFDATPVNAGDNIEIVRFVGGG